MKFNLNSNVELRFFERVDDDNNPRHLWDVFTVVLDGDVNTCMTVGGTTHFTSKVKVSETPVTEPVSDPPVECDDTSFRPEYQTEPLPEHKTQMGFQ